TRCAGLDGFRRRSDNLYERVRALFFLYALHRFHLPARLAGTDLRRRTAAADPHEVHLLAPATATRALVPFKGYEHLLQRRFEEAIENFLSVQKADGPSDGLSSALATAYHRFAFQTLADQVRRSVRSVRGNQWMFRMGHPQDQPLRIRPELLRSAGSGAGVPPAARASRPRTPSADSPFAGETPDRAAGTAAPLA